MSIATATGKVLTLVLGVVAIVAFSSEWGLVGGIVASVLGVVALGAMTGEGHDATDDFYTAFRRKSNLGHDLFDSGFGIGRHALNIDGTPMIGSTDINGNVYGCTSALDSHSFRPSVNIDGSPMMGSVDIHGNPYGVTSDHWHIDHSFSMTDTFSSHDSFSSSSGMSSWS